MEKIVINKETCIGCGLCVSEHPEYLIFDEMGHAEPVGKEINPNDKTSILNTVEHCPVQAIVIEEEKENV